MRKLAALLVLNLLGVGICAASSVADSTSYKQSDRNVSLNAESATIPRELNIGLPESGNGAVVFIDGMKAAQGLPSSHYHWGGGNAYTKSTNFSLQESVIRTGEISSPVNSWTKLGKDKSEGIFTLRSSNNGRLFFDGFFSGPVKGLPGWYFSAGAYINYDPTSVNAPSCKYVDRKQIYQLNLSKRWENSELDFLYRYSWCGDQLTGLYNVAPFTYNGDGSITIFKGFDMGYDSYFPADDMVEYMDLVTGKSVKESIGKMNDRRIHDISVLWKHSTPDGWRLNASGHLVLMPHFHQGAGSLAGIDYATADKGFTYTDWAAYNGYVQNRLVRVSDMTTYDLEVLFEARKVFQKHTFHAGVSSIFADQYQAASSFIIAHTAEADPVRLYFNGRNSWDYNKSALYFGAKKLSTAFFAFDRWKLAKNLEMLLGLRLKPVNYRINSVARLDGEEKNRRIDGFNLADPSLAEIHKFHRKGLDYAISECLDWNFGRGFHAIADGFYSITNKSSTYFRNSTIPSLKAIGNAQGRLGITYANSWMNIAGILSYITSWHNAATLSVTKQINGLSETIPWTAQYGIGTKGFSVDGNIFRGGWKCHFLLTWQDPRYHNYTNQFVFSDGSTQTIDYTDNIVTGISKVIMELDPSYKWKNLRVWASARYYSRRYASRTNYAYFNSRIETFGGIDWDCRKDTKISLSMVNLLGQGGVKGSIDIADTIDDPSELAGYVMAGTFIRPFTVELTVTYKF